MNLLEQNDSLVREKIEAMSQGEVAGLATIFGKDWESIGTTGERKEFGRLFKEAVLNGTYPEISWIGIENSGRYDLYKKS